MKITLPLQWDKHWFDVEGEILDVSPHLASVATFAIHRNPEGSLRWGKWTVSNVETGMHVLTLDAPRNAAIEKVREKLASVDVEVMERGYQKAIAQAPQLAAELRGDR